MKKYLIAIALIVLVALAGYGGSKVLVSHVDNGMMKADEFTPPFNVLGGPESKPNSKPCPDCTPQQKALEAAQRRGERAAANLDRAMAKEPYSQSAVDNAMKAIDATNAAIEQAEKALARCERNREMWCKGRESVGNR